MREATSLGVVDNSPSPRIWQNCPWHAIRSGTRRGIVFHDDFENMFNAASTEQATSAYMTLAENGGTVAALADPVGAFGALALLTSATDNDQTSILSGGGTGGAFAFLDPAVVESPTDLTPHEIWFEARFKVSAITGMLAFVGFAGEGANVDNGTMADTTGALTGAADTLGLKIVQSALTLSFSRGGVEFVTPITVATLVADTYIKAGFHYNPNWPTAHKIAGYANNDKIATKVTLANIQAATFPDGDALCLHAVAKNETAAARTVTVDWWRAAVLEL